MASRLISDLDAALQPLAQKFLDGCAVINIEAFITQTYRSCAEQDADYAQGRTAPGHILTNARGGESPHNCTLPDGTPAARAFDFGIKLGDGELDWDAEDDEWQTALEIGKSLGLISGSTFHGIQDNPHFELPNWRDPITTI